MRKGLRLINIDRYNQVGEICLKLTSFNQSFNLTEVKRLQITLEFSIRNRHRLESESDIERLYTNSYKLEPKETTNSSPSPSPKFLRKFLKLVK